MRDKLIRLDISKNRFHNYLHITTIIQRHESDKISRLLTASIKRLGSDNMLGRSNIFGIWDIFRSWRV